MFMNTGIETKKCTICRGGFEITDEDMRFYERASPTFNGKKYLIPPPKLCPSCRRIRRMTFRNEGKLYKRKCALTQKDIVTIYSEDKNIIVYDNEVWYSHDIVPEK